MTVDARKPAKKKPLMVNFKKDSLTTVSRETVKALADKLGFNDTQTVLFALARPRDEVLVSKAPEMGNFEPLTDAQLAVIRKAAPRTRGKVLSTLLQ